MLNTPYHARSVFLRHQWEEGKIIPIACGVYRARVMVTCYAAGRQRAQFANGEGAYGEYVELMRPDDQSWIEQGTNIVPVLPDGRLIMVVEQRPPQWRFSNQPTTIIVAGQDIDLRQFGPYSSLEFPGGAVDKGDNLTSGFLRELEEETEVEEQEALLYQRERPFFPMGSDVALEMKVGVVYLERGGFSGFVKSDGGLHVLALTREDVQMNIWAGNIRSGQAALHGWSFYQEVHQAHSDLRLGARMRNCGYLSYRRIRIKRGG